MGLKAPRGYGWLTNQRKAAYNRIYSRTSRGCLVSLAILILFGVALAAQIASAGGHRSGSHSSGGTVHVSSYYRKDGTYVHSYDRAAPGSGSGSYSGSGSHPGSSSHSGLKAPSVYEPTLGTTSAAAATTPYVAPIPANATVHVREYDREDGRHVKEYVRSAPGYADTVVAVASSPRREKHTITKPANVATSTNAGQTHYSDIPYANSITSGVNATDADELSEANPPNVSLCDRPDTRMDNPVML
jgi:hypothetical protein